jgi:excinuclease ABC subunit C
VAKNFEFSPFLRTLTNQPGVYRMYDNRDIIIYVGKAKNLKSRVSSYFHNPHENRKKETLVSKIFRIDVTVTSTEIEALLLEYNYIKRYQPRYNVLMRDDKSYPYIILSANTPHPRLAYHRGSKNTKGEYFGPFPCSSDVRKVLAVIKKIFPIRQCEDRTYSNRSQPCLQYQINRCLAPCINGLVSDEGYTNQVNYIRMFLSGKSNHVTKLLKKNMDFASRDMNFEEAARLRDQISAVKSVTEKQYIFNQDSIANLDVMSLGHNLGVTCLHTISIRQGKVIESQSYFPILPFDADPEEISDTFISQFYLQRNDPSFLPKVILVDFYLPRKEILSNLLSDLSGKNILIKQSSRDTDLKYLGMIRMARVNNLNSLTARISKEFNFKNRSDILARFIGIKKLKKIECFDISHTMGKYTTASCVVFDASGPLRSQYRHYGITNIIPGDDCAAMGQAIFHRYKNYPKDNDIPDMIIIDGGKAQLIRVKKVLESLNLYQHRRIPMLLSIAKNKDRKPGKEKIFIDQTDSHHDLLSEVSVLNFIRYIRDEAHRYAIKAHRNKRDTVGATSFLESIEGVGPKKCQYLLKTLGGLQELEQATVEEIALIPQISLSLAKRIHKSLLNRVSNLG